jgi:phage prohead protease, HK97 family
MKGNRRYGVKVGGVPGKIKDLDTKRGVVVSYPSTFNNIDSQNERVMKGAFARTINSWGPEGKQRVKALFNHEPWSIVGKPIVLREDDIGLYAETQFVPTTLSKDVLTLVEHGVITEQSIGFSPVVEEKNEDDGVLDIREVKLYEYSFLAWGANMDTPIVGVKGASDADSLNALVGEMAARGERSAQRRVRDGRDSHDAGTHVDWLA